MKVEKALDCHAAFVLGGAGNITSNSRLLKEEDTYIVKGQKLAAEAVEAAKNFAPLETGPIQMQERKLVIEGNARENVLYTFGFGEFGIAFAPWEIFDTNAVAVREDSKYPYTFYASVANTAGMNGYLDERNIIVAVE